MIWYYTDENRNQAGPLSNADFEASVRSGVIHGETLVWKEGFTAWIKYSEVAGNAGALGAARCCECGKQYAPEEMLNFEGAWVCAACKPLYIQKLREGVATGSVGTFWRSGKRLVIRKAAGDDSKTALPRRCVKCNESTETEQLKRKLYWHHPAIYISILLSVLIYVILALCCRKKATAYISVCPRHRSARRNVILFSWLLVLGGIGAFAAGAAQESGWLMLPGVILFLGGIIFGIARGRLVFATKIDKEHVWIGGCKPEFLAEFPEWTGPK